MGEIKFLPNKVTDVVSMDANGYGYSTAVGLTMISPRPPSYIHWVWEEISPGRMGWRALPRGDE